MDILKYAEAKARGAASITKHGATTLLVSIDGVDNGYQPADIQAAIERATPVANWTPLESAEEKARAENQTAQAQSAIAIVQSDLADLDGKK